MTLTYEYVSTVYAQENKSIYIYIYLVVYVEAAIHSIWSSTSRL